MQALFLTLVEQHLPAEIIISFCWVFFSSEDLQAKDASQKKMEVQGSWLSCLPCSTPHSWSFSFNIEGKDKAIIHQACFSDYLTPCVMILCQTDNQIVSEASQNRVQSISWVCHLLSLNKSIIYDLWADTITRKCQVATSGYWLWESWDSKKLSFVLILWFIARGVSEMWRFFCFSAKTSWLPCLLPFSSSLFLLWGQVDNWIS